jgi:hypothetical protein
MSGKGTINIAVFLFSVMDDSKIGYKWVILLLKNILFLF